MWRDLFRGFTVVHAMLAILAAIGFFKLWARTRFWLPRYAHVLAGIGFLAGLLVLSAVPADVRQRVGLLRQLLGLVIIPAFVYFFFIFYGGNIAALRSVAILAPCPFCQVPIPAISHRSKAQKSQVRFLEKTCEHCGHSLDESSA